MNTIPVNSNEDGDEVFVKIKFTFRERMSPPLFQFRRASEHRIPSSVHYLILLRKLHSKRRNPPGRSARNTLQVCDRFPQG
jgi:hypothetical protein